MCYARRNVIVFGQNNLREPGPLARAFSWRSIRGLAPESCMSEIDPWLGRYPLFREALRHGATSLNALPLQARTVVFNRLCMIEPGAKSTKSTQCTIGEVRVAYVELPMTIVDAAVRTEMADQSPRGAESLELRAALEENAVRYPTVARPPCLLMPGVGVFLDGWMRFLAYRARGDLTAPLLAVDWHDLYARVARADGESIDEMDGALLE
ncbi:hypothetical protein [Paraburkholderia tropica]|uniref:hypothetical protein n=2 Tax=Paraburkholderia TaxID=1822464 RepID=UPI001CC54C2E|nr:hypothetical protein [Paraburkholderia tropica]